MGIGFRKKRRAGKICGQYINNVKHLPNKGNKYLFLRGFKDKKNGSKN
jgi:hypothetical protein